MNTRRGFFGTIATALGLSRSANLSPVQPMALTALERRDYLLRLMAGNPSMAIAIGLYHPENAALVRQMLEAK